jgi:tetratricopeptide (TPR) repeat protein
MVRRNKLSFAAASAVAVSLVIGLTLSAVLFFRERTARERADEQAAITEAVNDFFLEDLLQQADSLYQAGSGFTPDPNLTVRQALDRAAKRIENRFKNQPLQEAAVRKAIGDALQGVGQAGRGIEHLRRAVQLRQAELGPDDRDTLSAKVSLARAYAAAGKSDQALLLQEETLRLAKATLGPHDEVTVNTMSDLARSYRQAGRLAQALTLYEQTLELNQSNGGPDHPDTLGAMNNLAMGYHRAGRLDLAVPLFEKALERMRVTLVPGDPFTQNAMSGLASAYQHAGRLDQALPLLEEAVRLREEYMGLDSPATLDAMDSLAGAFVAAKNFGDAGKLYRQMLDRLGADSGKGQPSEVPLLGFVLHHLAVVLLQQGMPNEARPFAEEALTVYARHTDWPTQESQHAFEVLKAVLKDLGDPPGAEAVGVKQMAALRAAAERDDLTALNNLAWILSTSSDPAARDGRSAMGFAERAVVLTNRKDPGMLDTLAAACAEAGEFGKATEILREAIGLCEDGPVKIGFAARLKLYESNKPFRDP